MALAVVLFLLAEFMLIYPKLFLPNVRNTVPIKGLFLCCRIRYLGNILIDGWQICVELQIDIVVELVILHKCMVRFSFI